MRPTSSGRGAGSRAGPTRTGSRTCTRSRSAGAIASGRRSRLPSCTRSCRCCSRSTSGRSCRARAQSSSSRTSPRASCCARSVSRERAERMKGPRGHVSSVTAQRSVQSRATGHVQPSPAEGSSEGSRSPRGRPISRRMRAHRRASRAGHQLFLRFEHAVPHQPAVKGAVHTLKRDAVAHRLPPRPRLANDDPRVPHTHPD
mmetsp:Transcript_5785/g.18211  ORF Transcript_5785/g.18211 Transcript_5785/m.18211 type:complete len:201 (+) Transcript_5785:348-950(+)